MLLLVCKWVTFRRLDMLLIHGLAASTPLSNLEPAITFCLLSKKSCAKVNTRRSAFREARQLDSCSRL
jgi:hypothetical protein